MHLKHLLGELEAVDFSAQLKRALLDLPDGDLPIGQFATRGMVNMKSLELMIISIKYLDECLEIKLGVFFNEILSGCVCSDSDGLFDEPVFVDMDMRLDKQTGDVSFDE